MNPTLPAHGPRLLVNRVTILEAALESIQRECESALDEPALLFMTMCRVASLTRQARERRSS